MFEDFTVLKETDDEEMRGPAKQFAQVPHQKLRAEQTISFENSVKIVIFD